MISVDVLTTSMGAVDWLDFLDHYRPDGVTARKMEKLLTSSGIARDELVGKSIYTFKSNMEAGVGPDPKDLSSWNLYTYLDAIVHLLTDPLLGMLDKPISALPGIDIHSLVLKGTNMTVPFKELSSFSFPI